MNTGRLRNGFWDRLRAALALVVRKQGFLLVRVYDIEVRPGTAPSFEHAVHVGYASALEGISLVNASGETLKELTQDNLQGVYGIPYSDTRLVELLTRSVHAS